MTHWHAGHNIAGYLPESDEAAYRYESWHDAHMSVVTDVEAAQDDADDLPDDAESVREGLLDVHCALHGATEDAPFLAYSPTNGGPHDLPTAWWVSRCDSADCF
jgi:hypothetical protein